MRVFILIFLLVVSGCANRTHTHEINHCGGIDIPICNVEVDGEMSLEDQEKLIKHKIMTSINLILDQVLQNILKGM